MFALFNLQQKTANYLNKGPLSHPICGNPPAAAPPFPLCHPSPILKRLVCTCISVCAFRKLGRPVVSLVCSHASLEFPRIFLDREPIRARKNSIHSFGIC